MVNPEWVEARTFGRWTGNIDQHVRQFTETEDGDLIVPRGQLDHLLNDLGRSWEVQDERVTPEAEKIWPEGNILLRPDDQEPAVQDVMSYENGFLSAPAGSGKTVMGLELCRRLGLKALWLTHLNQLKNQAIQEAVDLLEIPEEQVGIIHGKKWKIGEQLTVAMIPTLNKRDLAPLEEEFGVVVVDEAHHVPSRTFIQVVGAFAAKHIYGLTATAYRRDKLEAVMFNAIGPVVARIDHVELFEDEHLMIPTIRCRQTGWYPPKTPTMEYHDFMEAMVQDAGRNQLIVNDVVVECRDPRNACIVLVERTKHAEILTDMLKQRGVKAEFCVGAVDVSDTPLPGKRKKKRTIPLKVREQIVGDFRDGRLQTLVATYGLLKEGFNHPPLNRLFMATPVRFRGSVVQALGRIQRTAEGKTDAIAWDYIDGGIGIFANQADSRLFRVYKKMKMPVEETY
jgi:superfamily II DNA or RNA helicase